MKRLLSGIIAAAFLALVGVQAAHFHKDAADAKSDSCAVCATASQSTAQAPNAAPALSPLSTQTAYAVFIPAAATDAAVLAACARAPPTTA